MKPRVIFIARGYFIMTTIPAFVLGNGRSRQSIDLNQLKKHGCTFGCNAIYREFTPNVLIATDPPITREIELSGYARSNEFWTRTPSPGDGANKITINYGYSSGPIAVSMAADRGHRPIYLLGFDLVGINGKINNIYAGTACYREINAAETHWGNWYNQINAIMRDQFPLTKFIRVVNSTSFTPKLWKEIKNYSEISISEFSNMINNSSWQKLNE